MSKDYVTVTTHRRAMPKRKFADGGKSAVEESGRPDLDILAKQGLSPEKAPGMPPRITDEYLAWPRSDADTGGGKPVMLMRSGEDPVNVSDPGPKGSVLSRMMGSSADRVQEAHDRARATAALNAFYDAKRKRTMGPPQQKADGGSIDDDPFSTPSEEDLATQEDWEASRRRKAYGFDPTGAMTSGRRTAEMAAPRASVSPSIASLADPSRVTSRVPAFQNKQATPTAIPQSVPDAATSDLPAPPALPVPVKTAAANNSPGIPKFDDMSSSKPTSAPAAKSGVNTLAAGAGKLVGKSTADTSTSDPSFGDSSSDSAPNKIDWLQVVAHGLGEGRSTNPISAVGGVAGSALGAYLRKRRMDREGMAAKGDAKTSAGQGTVYSPRGIEQRRGGDMSPATPDYAPSLEQLEDLPTRSNPAMLPDDLSDMDFAKGGEVGPTSNQNSRWSAGRSMGRPAGRPMAPRPGGPPPGSSLGAAQPPGGGSLGPQMAQQAALANTQAMQGRQLGGMPPGAPPPGGPGINPQMMAQQLAQRAQMPGAMSPGGPPPGANAMGPMGGPPPGAMPGMGGPPSGPPPGAMPGMAGPPSGPPPGAMPMGGPPSGPPPGAMPPGGPPPGGGSSLGAMQGNQQQALQAALANQQAAMGPPPGGPPPGGPPPGGPPPGGPQQAALAAMLQNQGASAQSGAQQQQQAALQNAMAQQKFGGGAGGAQLTPDYAQGFAKGGHVIEDTEGFSPRAKHTRVRQFGDVGKPAEKLPPEPYKKGGKVKHRAPFGSGKKVAKSTPPVPMVTDEDMGTPPAMGLGAAGPAPAPMAAPPPPPVAPPPGPPPGMAMGGVAKLRRGYPNTNGKAKPKKMATGGKVRGCGAATKGCGFGGVC